MQRRQGGYKTRGRRGGRKGRSARSPLKPQVVRTPVVGCPDKVVVKLKYPVLKLINSLATASSSVRFYTNGVYDVDPTLGSTSTPYFAEWTQMYSYYRVLKYKLEIHATNNEAQTANIFIVHSNTDPGTTGIGYLQYANASYNRITSLAASTAQYSKQITSALSPMRIVGDRAVRTEQNFWGSSTSNPVDSTYVGIGASINSGNLTNGVYISGFLEFEVEFFDRKNLQTSYKFQPYDTQTVIEAINRIEQNDKNMRKQDPKDLEIRDAMVAWRQEREQDPEERRIRLRLQPYVRAT